MHRKTAPVGSPAMAIHTVIAVLVLVLIWPLVPAPAATWDGKVSQHGEMRKVLGEGRHEGRVRLGDLTNRPHCYGVGALAGLAGEVTIVDGQIVATRGGQAGQPVTEPNGSQDRKATMLVAAHVPRWTEHRFEKDVSADALEKFVREAARQAGLDVSRPFPFVIEGKLIQLEMHVINGACPMRAKRLGQKIPPSRQPFRSSLADTTGRLVGIYAAGAEHRLTHHESQTHTHVLLKDNEGQTYTAHVESTGVGAGALLRLPAR